MPQADGYIRISTLNDTTQAQRSTEQLGDTLADALDTTPAERATDAVTSLGSALRDTDGSASGLGDVQHGIDDVGNSAITTGQLIRANLISDTVMNGVKQLGAALKTTAVSAVSGAMSNETAFAKASTLLSGNDLEKYFEGLIDISNRTGVAFTDLAESMYSALSAGVDQEHVLEFVENSVRLSKGGFTQTATAIDIVTTALNAYDMEMENATHVQDVLITTQNKGKTTVDELAHNMGKIIPTAKSVNVEFDQLGAMYATVTANGVATAEATTYLNSMINELGSSGSTAEKAMMAATKGTELQGKKFAEISALGYDVTDVLALMSKEAAKSGQSLADMFSSSEASKAANILLSNMEGFKQNIEAMANSTGSAATAADTMMDTTAEKVQIAKNQIDNLTTSIANSLLPVIGEAAEEVSTAVSAGDVTEISSKLGHFISGTLTLLLNNIKLIGTALAGVTTSVVTYKTLMTGAKFITNFNSSAKALTTTFHSLRTATDSATAAQTANNAAVSANPYMAVISVISVLVGVFVALAGNIDSTTDKIENLRQSTKEFINAAEESESAAENIRGLAAEYTKLKTAAQETDEAKKRLKEIQDLLLTTYGTEANQLDLVNGKYAEQLGLLNELADAKSEDAERSAMAAYTKYIAAESLEQSLSESYNDFVRGIADDNVWELIKKAAASENVGIEITLDSGKNRLINIKGNTEQKMNAYDAIMKAYEQTGFILDDAGNYSKFADLYEKYKKQYNENRKTVDDYNRFINPENDYQWGSTIAAEEERKYKAAQSAREAAKQLSEEDKADNEALYKQDRADAKYSYDMGVIDAEEYYSTLASLRDKYLERDTDEWRSVNVELKKYYDSLTEEQKKAYEALLKQQKEAAEQARRERLASFNEEKSQLQFQHKTGQISEKKYYEELAKIRDKYLDKNSSEWRSAYLETYQYNQKIIQANKDALNELLTDTTDSTLSALQNIVNARDSLTSKLVDFNKTFEKITETVPETIAVKGEFTVTTAEHEIETYKMGADSIKDNIKILEEYGNMLDALKARGADDETLNDILAMDIDEAMEFGTKMLKMSDREWSGYFDSMARLRETAADISAKYYQSEVDNLKNNLVDRLREELFGLDSDMMSIGAEAALSLIEGWNSVLSSNDLTFGDLLNSLVGGSYATAPKMAQLLPSLEGEMKFDEARADNGKLIVPVYIGKEKLTEILIEGVNTKNIKVGKNVLNT